MRSPWRRSSAAAGGGCSGVLRTGLHRRRWRGGGFGGGRFGRRRIECFAVFQTVDDLRDGVEGVVDFLDLLAGGARRLNEADAALDGVRDFAEVHGAGHARAALQRVQQARQRARSRVVGRRLAPDAQLGGDLAAQVDGFLEEDRQQLFVQLVLQLRRRDREGACGRQGGRAGCGGRFRFRRGRFGGAGAVAGIDHGGREQSVERVDQVGSAFRFALFGDRGEHQFDLGDRLADHFARFDAARVGGVVAAQQRVLERQTEAVDRRQADGAGDAAQGVRGAVHLVRRRRVQFGLDDGELALQRRQVRARLFEEDLVERGRHRNARLRAFRGARGRCGGRRGRVRHGEVEAEFGVGGCARGGAVEGDGVVAVVRREGVRCVWTGGERRRVRGGRCVRAGFGDRVELRKCVEIERFDGFVAVERFVGSVVRLGIDGGGFRVAARGGRRGREFERDDLGAVRRGWRFRHGGRRVDGSGRRRPVAVPQALGERRHGAGVGERAALLKVRDPLREYRQRLLEQVE